MIFTPQCSGIYCNICTKSLGNLLYYVVCRGLILIKLLNTIKLIVHRLIISNCRDNDSCVIFNCVFGWMDVCMIDHGDARCSEISIF